MGHLDRGSSTARGPSGERLERHGRECVYVGERTGARALQLLRGHVGRRAEHGAATRDVGRLGRGRDPEVGHLGVSPFAEEHVRRLDVAVDHALSVRMVQARGHAAEDRDSAP